MSQSKFTVGIVMYFNKDNKQPALNNNNYIEVEDLDHAYEVCGGFGRLQLRAFFIIAMALGGSGFFLYSVPFYQR